MSIPSNLSFYKEKLREEHNALRENYLRTRDAQRLLVGRKKLIDQVLAELWQNHELSSTPALIAVGGYGRGELYPYSDIDILILLPQIADESLAPQIEKLIGFLWDIGLDLGHSVRTVEECLAESARDITVQTNLLEARLVAGNAKLFRQFYKAIYEQLDKRAFFKAKQLEQEQRHAQYQEAPYSLEPNFKESPGGLRDLHVILWISRFCRIAHSWSELSKKGFITASEARQLKQAEQLLKHIRIRTHYLAQRREDRLLFDYQNLLAKELGFSTSGIRRPGEFLMQRYYQAAKTITQLNTILLQNLGTVIFPARTTRPITINERFQISHELLDTINDRVFEKEPQAIFESFLLLQQHPELKGMTAPTLRALWRAGKKINAAFRRDKANRARFIEIIQQPSGLVHALRRMNQYDILGKYIVPFGKVVGQMQHDLFHVYTVDQHILMVVRNLRRFTMLEHAHEYPFCSQLMANFERSWLLYLAGLFHDIAKGRGGDHSELGKVDALRFCRAHGLSKEDTELVAWIVEQHLTMSSVAQKQDLSDPDVIRAFADMVKSERRLTALYLFTVADIRGTSPKVWNAWKAKLLEDLFHLTRRFLAGGQINLDHDLQKKQSEALRILRLYALSETVQEKLWRELDTAYFMRHDAQEIAWHTRVLHYRIDADIPVVKTRWSPIGEGIQVMIYVRDQPNLFARISGFFEKLNFNIVEAKIHTTKHGYALDSFLVLDPAKNQHHQRDVMSLIENGLSESLSQQTPLETPRQGRVSRRVKHFPITPQVHIQPDEKGAHYLLSVTAADRTGLLYSIAYVLAHHRINLHTAKITTLGERAEDIFILSGEELAKPKSVIQIETELLERLQP